MPDRVKVNVIADNHHTAESVPSIRKFGELLRRESPKSVIMLFEFPDIELFRRFCSGFLNGNGKQVEQWLQEHFKPLHGDTTVPIMAEKLTLFRDILKETKAGGAAVSVFPIDDGGIIAYRTRLYMEAIKSIDGEQLALYGVDRGNLIAFGWFLGRLYWLAHDRTREAKMVANLKEKNSSVKAGDGGKRIIGVFTGAEHAASIEGLLRPEPIFETVVLDSTAQARAEAVDRELVDIAKSIVIDGKDLPAFIKLLDIPARLLDTMAPYEEIGNIRSLIEWALTEISKNPETVGRIKALHAKLYPG